MAEANNQGRPKQTRMPKLRSVVWNHFTLITVNEERKAQCNHCPSRLNGTHGTTSLLKHLVNHFTTRIDDQGDRKGIVRCNICPEVFAASDPRLLMHVKECIKMSAAPSVGASEPPPPVQTGAPSGSGAEQGAAASVEAAEPPPPVQSHAPPGSGAEQGAASSMGSTFESLSSIVKLPSVQDDHEIHSGQSNAAEGASQPPPPVQPAGQCEDEASKDLARMIALGGHNPSVVEDDYFKSFVRRLAPRFVVPTRHAIEGMCDSVFDEAKEDFVSRLRDTDAKFSFSLGTTKTIEAGQVLYLACHFIDNEWNLHRMVTEAQMEASLKFHNCPSVDDPLSNCPLFNYDDLSQQLRYFFEDKIISGLYVRGTDQRRPFMTACGIPSLHNQLSDAFGTYIRTTTYMDNVFHSIAQCFSSYLDFENMDDGFDIYNCALDLTRQKRQKLLSDRGLEHVWTHDEQWYSWYCSLEVLEASSYQFRPRDRDSEIRRLMLKIWGEIFRAIQSISASRSPTSNLYLIELFKVREVLYSEEAAQVKELADCLTKARETLDKAIEDSYELWSIPLVLDPRYKLEHIKSLFGNSFGSEAGEYISEVTEDIEEMYLEYSFGSEAGNYISAVTNSIEEMYICDNSSQEAMTELDRYLTDSPTPDKEGFDVLKWWKEDGMKKYPMVARMARDALAMPTCCKPSSEQTAQVRSIVRGYSKKKVTE